MNSLRASSRGAANTPKENWIKDIEKNRCRLRFIVALSILCLLGSGAAIWVAVVGYNHGTFMTSTTTYRKSGPISASTSVHFLDATDGALTMTLENDFSGRVGEVYSIVARSAQMHTVTILSGGQNPTFGPGSAKIAKFGGAIGDGFVFQITSANTMFIWFVNNVDFN